ncbi:MAG: CehA/McbA family metallohydrolase [Myxococcaceae bacterium]|nr:CehA/McbA family metallohydrolase [Myxococcaceae bacterium]
MRRIFALLVIGLALAPQLSCSKSVPPARAFKINSRHELIGGQRALAEIGDYKISNGIIHAIVQDVGTSRGFGAFGGSLIDIDLVRDSRTSATAGVVGNDFFTEMFPAFFLHAVEPSKVEVLADGSDGAAAKIRVTGGGGEFISVVKDINDSLNLVPRANLEYTVDYTLEPGKQYLKIVTTVTNKDTRDATYGAVIPFGFVTLLGEGQRLFLPNEAGFNVRFHLEEVYKRPSELQALPGEVVPMITTAGEGVSYAVSAAPFGPLYMNNKPEYYRPYGAKPDSILIPIASSSFLGTFWSRPPALPSGDPGIAPGKSHTFIAYVSVGTGDVASVQKVAYAIDDPEARKSPTKLGIISGVVRETVTGNAMRGISVVLQDEAGRYQSQAHTTDTGSYIAWVPPGRYRAYAVERARSVAVSEGFVEVKEDETQLIDLNMDPPGVLNVTVRDEQGRALPAKVSVEGIYDHTGAAPPRDFLYNLNVGERYRNSDLVPDDTAESSRRYLETFFFAAQGNAGRELKPGRYRVYASRGPEYSLESEDVLIEANKTVNVQLMLKHELPTPGWASADFHVHSINSVDSDMGLPERVTSYAVEGIDLVASTDHNYVSDFAPTIDALNLSDWLHSTIGLELTTLEMGHFNGFPLKVQPGPVTHGSFAWFRRPPGELFAQLRGLGSDPASTIIQVNHPRDTILGYFGQFNMGTYTIEPYKAGGFGLNQEPLPDGRVSPYHPSQFSLDFDVMEVFNAKRDMLLFSTRVPNPVPPGPEPTSYPKCTGGQIADCVPAPGELLFTTVETLDGGSLLQPAFPGALDDWYSLLGHGKKITATGNSDSHGPTDEAGLPRTYMKVGASADGSMRGLSEPACMDALRKGQVVVTNGPFIELWVNGKEVGDTVVAPTGEVTVRVRVSAATWVDVDRVQIVRGGPDAYSPLFTEIPVTAADQTGDCTAPCRIDVTRTLTVPDKSFIVAVAAGDDDMWPVYTPYEINSFQISDAVVAIAGPLAASFGPAKWGKYAPKLTNRVRPYGFTNPVWVSYQLSSPLKAQKKVLPVGASEKFVPRSFGDLRLLFGQFHGHGGP